MTYIKPELVRSPKGRVQNLKVLKDLGEGEFSVAEMEWDGNEAVGVRWNGGDSTSPFEGLGNPQSRGIPTWFILPEPIARLVRENLDKID